jgi:hypothetical protein
MLSKMLQFLTILQLVYALAPLEMSDQKIYFGPWYERIRGDTPLAINTRLGHNLSLFQSDINITSTLQIDFLNNFLTQLDQTSSDAIAYLTVYPIEGFDKVSQSALQALADRINVALDTGRRFFIRYAPEMNGNWFVYSQQPSAFKKSWIQFVSFLRAQTNNSQNVAFIFGPNGGNGYPWLGVYHLLK